MVNRRVESGKKGVVGARGLSMVGLDRIFQSSVKIMWYVLGEERTI
jgi:hypothetical protein